MLFLFCILFRYRGFLPFSIEFHSRAGCGSDTISAEKASRGLGLHLKHRIVAKEWSDSVGADGAEERRRAFLGEHHVVNVVSF